MYLLNRSWAVSMTRQTRTRASARWLQYTCTTVSEAKHVSGIILTQHTQIEQGNDLQRLCVVWPAATEERPEEKVDVSLGKSGSGASDVL